jgi:pantoate--beta-alanine ligase
MVTDMNIPVAIHGVPTVREADGLALSSRNQYLSEQERAIAPKLYEVLKRTASQLRVGESARVLAQAKADLIAAGFAAVDYFELRAADTLAPLIHADRPARLLVATRLGKTRLIDNVAV